MSKIAKWGIALVLIGIVGAGVGLLISVGEGQRFFEDQDYVKVTESIDADALSRILVEMENRRIVIGESTTANIEVTYYESEKDPIDSSQEGDTFSLVNDPVWYWGFLWWMNWGRWFTGEKTTVTILIPEGTDWVLDLDTANGNIEIIEVDPIASLTLDTENGDLLLEKLAFDGLLRAKTTNGAIRLNEVQTASLSLSTTNGRVSLTDVTTGAITLTDTNGDILFTNVVATSIQATNTNGRYVLTDVTATGAISLITTNGNIDIVRITTVNLTCRSTNGDIEVTAHGTYEDFYCTFQTETGHVRVDGENAGEGDHHATQSLRMVLRTVNGSIDLDFLD
ncbi:MAG TPA: DUF4097 family beta strand repeat-containing protein [Bacillota bacterium]|nr:DUF4097 family beta strand repeat-containing protein [Bacillota bacterium]